MPRRFKSPNNNYIIGNFSTTKRPYSPSPKRRDYSIRAQTKEDFKSRCTYIHPQTGKRCRNELGMYPEFCELHTMMVYNLYIAPSQIPQGGNGLYVGPYGFKKGDIIGEYSFSWNKVSFNTLNNRCKEDLNCWDYTLCEQEQCWDGLDIRSTLMRNINDAHGSNFRNNAYFDIIDGHVYVIASRNVKPHRELLVTYGQDFWKNRN